MWAKSLQNKYLLQMHYVYHKLLNEIVKLAAGQMVWKGGQAVKQVGYPKYNQWNEKYNEADPKYNPGNEKYNEADPLDNQEGVDPKLVDFLSSSQRRNTDSLWNKGLKWAADDPCNLQKGKCAKGKKRANVQMCKSAKCKKGKWPVEGRRMVPEPGRPSRVARSHGLPELQGLVSTIKYQKSLQLI